MEQRKLYCSFENNHLISNAGKYSYKAKRRGWAGCTSLEFDPQYHTTEAHWLMPIIPSFRVILGYIMNSRPATDTKHTVEGREKGTGPFFKN